MRVTDEDGFTRWAVSSIGIGIDAYVAQGGVRTTSQEIWETRLRHRICEGLFSFDPFDMHLVADGIHTDAEEVWLYFNELRRSRGRPHFFIQVHRL